MKARAFRRLPRPSTISRATPRSRPAAASELARLEFERERLIRELETLSARRDLALSSLTRIETRARQLHTLLETYSTLPEPETVS